MVNESGIHDRDWLGFDWSPWVRLDPREGELESLSEGPGLYRVRHDAYDGLVYVGETGRNLQGRVRALVRGVYDERMPFNDPHTASPCLWAIRDRHGPGFEVSGATPEAASDPGGRKAMRDALIGVHRQETGENLVANFGRMPPGYTKSNQRSTRIRGARSDDADRSYRDGIPPLPWTNPEGLTDSDWMGLSWSAATALGEADAGGGTSDAGGTSGGVDRAAGGVDEAAAAVPDARGLYRLWDPEASPPLEYVAETVSLRSRFVAHRRNADARLRFSYVTRPTHDEKFQLRQAEASLRGAHWLACGTVPRLQ